MYSKISVWGRNIHPLYRWLTSHSEHGGIVKWNFTKFLINRDGDVVDRFHTFIDPEADQLTSAIENSCRFKMIQKLIILTCISMASACAATKFTRRVTKKLP